jgi:type I restriction enzyme R subunit
VEFKSTARWDLRDGKPNKAMEDAVVKTIAGFLNTDGGTLLIGIDNSARRWGLIMTTSECSPRMGTGS